MTFRVEISPSALADVEDIFLWMQRESPSKADEWFNGLVEAILTLEQFPNRCPKAPESEDIGL
ncbi:MAG: type II toxin-antitoxin system RelE/ParE family toxin [Planktothrix sp.]|uniref:type II toxin-antitoxin system RelE/ParE family toxin n=1 Tax=Planktothrix sp. TaxID=3088171 RepID=UPI0038D48B1B